jgi:hypothetical protein
MTREELAEEIEVELEIMNETVREAIELRDDVGDRDPTVREKTATAAFLAQFYGGSVSQGEIEAGDVPEGSRSRFLREAIGAQLPSETLYLPGLGPVGCVLYDFT